MADDYYYRISTSQDQLRYAYEDGQNHMKYHPDVVEEYRQIIEKHPHFKSEKEALQYAIKLYKEIRRGLYRYMAAYRYGRKSGKRTASIAIRIGGK